MNGATTDQPLLCSHRVTAAACTPSAPATAARTLLGHVAEQGASQAKQRALAVATARPYLGKLVPSATEPPGG